MEKYDVKIRKGVAQKKIRLSKAKIYEYIKNPYIYY